MSLYRKCMTIAKSLSEISLCHRTKVGALIVKEGEPVRICTGVNGPIIEPCPICPRASAARGELLESCFGTHAEVNAIVKGMENIDISGSTLYTTLFPCTHCAKLAIAVGVVKVVYMEDYPKSEIALSLLKAANVEVIKYNEEEDNNNVPC